MNVSGTRPTSQAPAQATQGTADRQVELLANILVRQGQCDAQTIDRGRRVAAESGQRLDLVLLQLGLVTERGLAEGYATLLSVPLAGPARYPEAPLFPERLTPRFLRNARALPLSVEHDTLVIAVADALDEFTPAAIAAATGMPVRLEIAVPIEAADRVATVAVEEVAEERAGEGVGPALRLSEEAGGADDSANVGGHAGFAHGPAPLVKRQLFRRPVHGHRQPFDDAGLHVDAE